MKKIIVMTLLSMSMLSCQGSSGVNDNPRGMDADSLNPNLAENTVFPNHAPIGEARGVMPGRVTWTWNRKSVNWDGSGYWWELNHFDENVIQELTDKGIANLAGAATAKDGWNALFEYNNKERGRSGGYQAGQKIAIKANINGAAEYDDDPHGHSGDSYTNPVVLRCLLVSLVREAGVAPEDITVYDVTRIFPDYMQELCQKDITNGVNFVGRDNGVADESAPIVWSALKNSTVNYLPTCVTEADYLINLANLKGHNYGITLCGKNHFGSFINTWRMRAPQEAGLHGNVSQRKLNAYSVLVDLMGNYQLGAKTMLYMFDALICPSENTITIAPENSLWEQPPFNGDYTCSLFFSQDPVAIDGVGADFLINEPVCTRNNSSLRNNKYCENYIHEAALAGNPPSGTEYLDGNGEKMKSLGVHEHWNNVEEKKYSRNFGKDRGIELVLVDLNSATGIKNTTADERGESGGAHTLSGVAVTNPINGIYIKDNQKILYK